MTGGTRQLTKLQIQNFKSLKDISISPGRVNVFIGKPNAGKTNLLEALTLLGTDFKEETEIPKSNLRYTNMPSLFYDQNYNEWMTILTNQQVASMQKRGDGFYWTLTVDLKKNETATRDLISSPCDKN